MLLRYNFLIAPDSFKNCLTAKEVTKAIQEGLNKNPITLKNKTKKLLFPLSDGGEGSLEVLKNLEQAKITYYQTTHPLMTKKEKMKVKLAINSQKKLAIVESAKACGLELIPLSKRSIYNTTSYPLGEIINKLIQKKYRKIIITLGGSATNDGGLGMLQALGAKISLNSSKKNSNQVKPQHFSSIKKIDLNPVLQKIKGVKIIILADVENQLLGEKGATFVFARQKNHRPLKTEDLQMAEKQMEHLVEAFQKYPALKKKHLLNGSGAAGGLGYALLILSGKIISGFDYIAKAGRLQNLIKKSNFIFTGEGNFDQQSYMGKVVGKMIDLVKPFDNKKLFIVTGKTQEKLQDKNTILLPIHKDDFLEKNSLKTILAPKTNHEKIKAIVSAINFTDYLK